MHPNDITSALIEVCMNMHRQLGPGLLESILAYELRKLGFEVAEEQPIPVAWEEVKLEIGFR